MIPDFDRSLVAGVQDRWNILTKKSTGNRKKDAIVSFDDRENFSVGMIDQRNEILIPTPPFGL